MVGMSNLTSLLEAAASGDAQSAAAILPLVYDELRKLAAGYIAGEPAGQSLSPTALVHEAYLRLVGPDDRPRWAGRGHFFTAAATAMRRVLIDAARRRSQLKRGGGRVRAELADNADPASGTDDELLALDEALARLAVAHPLKAQLVELRYFAGLSEAEAAEVLGLSRATASRHWAFARAWLRDAIDSPGIS
jgi:RNA polymerase sigma factor (TIGR02999 family)